MRSTGQINKGFRSKGFHHIRSCREGVSVDAGCCTGTFRHILRSNAEDDLPAGIGFDSGLVRLGQPYLKADSVYEIGVPFPDQRGFDKVHGWGADKTRDEPIGGLLIDLQGRPGLL